MPLTKENEILVSENRFLFEQLSLVKETIKEAIFEFDKFLYQEVKKMQLSEEMEEKVTNILEGKQDTKTSETKEEEKDNHQIRKVFKKIAIETHPDKLISKSDFEIEYKASLFEKAKKSLDDNDFCGIIEVAKKLDIEVEELTEQQIKEISLKNQEMSHEIRKFKSSVAWVWFFSDEESRKNIMERFVAKAKHDNFRT